MKIEPYRGNSNALVFRTVDLLGDRDETGDSPSARPFSEEW